MKLLAKCGPEQFMENIWLNGIEKNGTDEPICRAGIETQTKRMDFRTQKRKEMVGQRVTLT